MITKAFLQIIQDLHNDYFAKFNAKFKPKDNLKIIRQTAIEATLNGLTEVGLQVGLTDGLQKILHQNITTGGSYAAMTEKLRDYMLTNDKR